MAQIRRKEPNAMNTSECNFSQATTLLIGLNILFYKIFAKQHLY